MILMNLGGIFGERDTSPNPMGLETNYQLHPQWPSDSYTLGGNPNEVLEIEQGIKSDQWSLFSERMSYEETSTDHNGDSYNSLDDNQQQTTALFSEGQETSTDQNWDSYSSLDDDQQKTTTLFSEGEDTSTGHNGDSYNGLDDDQQQSTTCKQCCTLGSDEMVIPKLHNWPMSTDHSHTTLCKYCREEVKKCYYDCHLVKCVEHWKEEQHGCDLKRVQTYSHDQANKHYSSEKTRHFNDYNFIVNCTAIQETTVYSYF